MVDSIAIASSELSEEQARDLTDRTREAGEVFWELVVRCHNDGAWVALGYLSWGAYVEAEFAMTARNAYRLLDQAQVILALEAGVTRASQVVDATSSSVESALSGTPPRAKKSSSKPIVSARQAQALKGDLPMVAKEVEKAVKKGKTPAQAVAQAVEKRAPERQKIEPGTCRCCGGTGKAPAAVQKTGGNCAHLMHRRQQGRTMCMDCGRADAWLKVSDGVYVINRA